MAKTAQEKLAEAQALVERLRAQMREEDRRARERYDRAIAKAVRDIFGGELPEDPKDFKGFLVERLGKGSSAADADEAPASELEDADDYADVYGEQTYEEEPQENL
ncbi:MAG: hypothetical protein IJ087_22205 [Eggerthellaceae bacterium]|nr:hypothetical protein [Eggerthellaceae bacterium]